MSTCWAEAGTSTSQCSGKAEFRSTRSFSKLTIRLPLGVSRSRSTEFTSSTILRSGSHVLENEKGSNDFSTTTSRPVSTLSPAVCDSSVGEQSLSKPPNCWSLLYPSTTAAAAAAGPLLRPGLFRIKMKKATMQTTTMPPTAPPTAAPTTSVPPPLDDDSLPNSDAGICPPQCRWRHCGIQGNHRWAWSRHR